MIRNSILVIVLLSSFISHAQNGYWQQAVDYTIDIDFNVETHQFTGEQQVVYTNNSPDTLEQVFFHLYFNAFQPGSDMDVRSRTIQDPDKRVGDRISKLTPEEIGYHRLDYLLQDGDTLSPELQGTVLEVLLSQPILPGEKTIFSMAYNSQVPIQIRRSGRDNKEGIDYTMTQWYPKLAEYDKHGWHANPYIGREFHGVWGDFDVSITIDKSYVLAGTGIVQNPQEVGHGYQDPDAILAPLSSPTVTWKFKAEQVHDFAWAADPDYQHDQFYVPGGPTLHFFYQTDTLKAQWKEIQPKVGELFQVMNAKFGTYPYPQFSVIQGGDGGMEYPMCTMIRGHGSFNGMLGLIAHEAFHNWYYGVLATNEAKYPWMDEGFTSFAEQIVMDSITNQNAKNPLAGYHKGYARFTKSPLHEPMSIHADRFKTNAAYSVSSYVKGALFLDQLRYITGDSLFYEGMRTYFNQWKFKHPEPDDFKRVMEKVSGLELDWYFEQWIFTTNVTDYGIRSVEKNKKETSITLERIGANPMPLDLTLTLKDGSVRHYYIPMALMRGEKPAEQNKTRSVLPDWSWVQPTYTFVVDVKKKHILSLAIDPSGRMADVNLENNTYPTEDE